MRRAVRVAALCALVAAASCKGPQPFTLQNAAETLVGDIDDLFGGKSAAVKHLTAIRDVNDPSGRAFRKDAEDALDTTRRAVRALATCDYPSWNEAALTIGVLSSMADEHESALVRAECVDTMARMAPWTFKYAATPEHPSTDNEVFDGLKTLNDASGLSSDATPEAVAAVTDAVNVMTNHLFDRVELAPNFAGDNRAVALSYRKNLRTVRVALRLMSGRSLLRIAADPSLHDALETAYPTLASSVIRLTLLKAALADLSEPTRSAAVRQVATLAIADGGAVLKRVLVYDGYASVRREAAKAFAAYPAPVAVPALIDGLADEMAEVRGAAAGSLAAVTGEKFGDDRGAWLRWWQTSGSKSLAAGAGK